MYATKEVPRTPGGFHQGLASVLRHPRYEVFPLEGIEEEVAAHAPAYAKVAVTASPRRGLSATLDLTERLIGMGYAAVPHLSARLIADEVQLKDVLDRLEELHVREVFVIAGDPDQPAGPYAGAVDLLEAMAGLGHRFDEVGVAGYPERHPKIDDDVAVQSMWDKRRHATYVVSQLCFDPVAVLRWVARLRRRGIDLPVHLGVPGPTAIGTLLRMSRRVGVGDSSRFLASQGKGLLRLGRPGRYTPDRLVDKLVPRHPGTGEAPWVGGLHFYTFNDIAAAEQWRRAKLARLGVR